MYILSVLFLTCIFYPFFRLSDFMNKITEKRHVAWFWSIFTWCVYRYFWL